MSLPPLPAAWRAKPRAIRLPVRRSPMLAMMAATALTGCTVGPDFQRPAASAAPQPTSTALAQTLDVSQPVARDWWTSFGDPVQHRIEEKVLAGNLDLAEAATHVAKSRAALRIAGADLLPEAAAAASVYKERASPLGILALTGAGQPEGDAASGDDPFGTTTLEGEDGSPPFDLWQVGADASWTLDLWGKARRGREAAAAGVEAAYFSDAALRVALSAEVANTYAALRGAETRLSILERNRDLVGRGLQIAKRREEQGATDRHDAAAAAAEVAGIEAAIPEARRDAAAARNALALLCGAEPHALDAMLADGDAGLPDVPATLPGGISGDLARARPDIMAAEARLHAATAQIGVAKANFYPSISLGGSFGFQGLSFADMASWDAHQFIVGPSVHLPIFEGGKLKGELELTKAEQKAAAIRYRATVLKAWHEIDNALASVKAEEERLAAASEGVKQAQIAMHVAERRYGKGATAYTDVLIAQRTALAREAEEAQARMAHAMAVSTLYQSLGGGWTPGEEPAA